MLDDTQKAMMDYWDQVVAFVTAYGLSVLGGIMILIVGWTLAGWASRAVDAALSRVQSFDLTLRRFIASIIRYIILTFTILAVLSQFGVQTASLIAVFGAAGLAIGLALQGTLANLAAGVMILIFRPFKIGDMVTLKTAVAQCALHAESGQAMTPNVFMVVARKIEGHFVTGS